MGIGSSTSISIRLGQRDYEGAENLLGNTVTLNLIVGISLGLICLLFIDPILRFFGASDTTLPYARSYMEIILLGNAVTHTYLGMNSVLRAASKPEKAMYATIFTVLVNVVLDMLFICWLGWGIRGAAFATVISPATCDVLPVSLVQQQTRDVTPQTGHLWFARRLGEKTLSVSACRPF